MKILDENETTEYANKQKLSFATYLQAWRSRFLKIRGYLLFMAFDPPFDTHTQFLSIHKNFYIFIFYFYVCLGVHIR